MPLTIKMSSGAYQSGWRIDVDCRSLTLHSDCPCLQERCNQSNDTMSAHSTIALVMHEQHSQVGTGCHRRRNHAAIHIKVAAWFPHQCSPDMIKVLMHEAPSLKHACTR